MIHIRKILFVFLLVLSGKICIGQEIEAPEIRSIVDVNWSNDFIYGTDYYYSNGLFFSLQSDFMKASPLNHILLPGLSEGKDWYGLNVFHAFYTPIDIYSSEIQYGDRPYAGVLLFGNTKYSEHPAKKLVVRSGIQLGVMGPLAGGEQMQNGIHNILWTSSPAQGWDHQIANEFCLVYSAGINKQIVGSRHILLAAELDARLGVPFTDFTPRIEVQVGKFSDPYLNQGLNTSGWQLYLRSSVSSRFVLYNGTIQGGIFNRSSPYTTDSENMVLGFDAGIKITYKRFSLEFTYNWISPEIVSGLNHRWSDLIFSFGF